MGTQDWPAGHKLLAFTARHDFGPHHIWRKKEPKNRHFLLHKRSISKCLKNTMQRQLIYHGAMNLSILTLANVAVFLPFGTISSYLFVSNTGSPNGCERHQQKIMMKRVGMVWSSWVKIHELHFHIVCTFSICFYGHIHLQPKYIKFMWTIKLRRIFLTLLCQTMSTMSMFCRKVMVWEMLMQVPMFFSIRKKGCVACLHKLIWLLPSWHSGPVLPGGQRQR